MNSRAVTRVANHVDEVVQLMNKGVPVEDWPELLQRQVKHWSAANELILDKGHKGKKFIASLLQIAFPTEIKRLSDAYLVISCAEEFFVKYSKVQREAERIYSIERLKREIYKASQKDDSSAVARLEAVLFKYLNPADDPIDAPDWRAIAQGVVIQPVYNPEVIDVPKVPKERALSMYNNFMQRLKAKEEDFTAVEEVKPTDD